MKKKHIMFITILIITLLLVLLPVTQVWASPTSFNNMLNWTFDEPKLPTKLSSIIGGIIAFVRNIALIITVLMITILGVKYMIGSVQEKADYKKDFPNIIIGLVLISGIFSIVSFIFAVAEGL